MKFKAEHVIIVLAILFVAIAAAGYASAANANKAVQALTVSVPTDYEGHTFEQNNIAKRLIDENKVGTIKHLYVIDPTSGTCLIYSTVDGKVTSSSKRLNPTTAYAGTVSTSTGDWGSYEVFGAPVKGTDYRTTELPEDDGTYGQSTPYIYWWDTAGNYNQLLLNTDAMIIIRDQPLAIKHVVINMNVVNSTEEEL